MTETEQPAETPQEDAGAPPEAETGTESPEPSPEPVEVTPERDEADEAAEQEEAPQPEAQGTTPEEWERRFKEADRAFKRYTDKATDLWAEDAVRLVPFVASPSAPPGFLSMDDAGRLPEDTKASLLEWLGFAREQDYEADPNTETCPICKGKGKTKTGSAVAGMETRTCVECGGRGFLDNSANGAVTLTVTSAPDGATVSPAAEMPQDDVDNWSEPKVLPDGRLNPNYGKMPNFKVAVEPWGVTAGLTAQDAAAVEG